MKLPFVKTGVMRLVRLRAVALIFCVSVSGNVLAELPQITDARVAAPPPGAQVAAVYLTVTNTGTEALAITGVQSAAAERAELHRSTVENDIARMEKQSVVTVPPGESLEFRHGSYHVMLTGLTQPLTAGSSIDMLLSTSAGDLSIPVPVISLRESMSTHDMSTHDTSAHDMSTHDTSTHDTSTHGTSTHDTSTHGTSTHDTSAHDKRE